VERRRSKLERPAARICDLLVGPMPGRAWLADHLDAVFGSAGLGHGARQCQWVVLAGNVHVHGSGAAHELD
jgi:hypothetical protein